MSSCKIYTGDYNGLVKGILIITVEVKLAQVAADKDLSPQIKVFGKINKQLAVQVMETIEQDKILCCRANGQVDLVENAEIKTILTMQESFVGATIYNDKLVLLSSNGKLFITRLNGEIETTVDLEQKDLKVAKFNPNEPNLFATGGKECDLHVWDLEKIENNSLKPVFVAKNVPHDFLDLRVPVWITDITWINNETLTTVTEYCHIRIYSIKKQRRPIKSQTFGENPIRCSCLNDSASVLFFGTNRGDVGMIDLKTFEMKKFQGVTGSVTDVKFIKSLNAVAVASIDRFMRVFSIENNKKPLYKVYLKQRLTRLAIVECEEEEEDDLWNDLQVVEDVKEPSQKRIKI